MKQTKARVFCETKRLREVESVGLQGGKQGKSIGGLRQMFPWIVRMQNFANIPCCAWSCALHRGHCLGHKRIHYLKD